MAEWARAYSSVTSALPSEPTLLGGAAHAEAAAKAAVRALYDLGRSDERPPTFREQLEDEYQSWRATQTPEQLAAWDARHNDDGSPKAGA